MSPPPPPKHTNVKFSKQHNYQYLINFLFSLGSKALLSEPHYEEIVELSVLCVGGGSHTHPLGLPGWPISIAFLRFPLKIFGPDKTLARIYSACKDARNDIMLVMTISIVVLLNRYILSSFLFVISRSLPI